MIMQRTDSLLLLGDGRVSGDGVVEDAIEGCLRLGSRRTGTS